MRSHYARWLFTALTLGACDRAAAPEPQAARESQPSRPSFAPAAPSASLAARPGAGGGGVAPVANMPPGTACPPYFFLNNINYSVNPSFEVGPGFASWPPGPTPTPSAATGWYMHSSNDSATVMTQLVPTNVPGPGGSRMLLVRAGSNEGGVYQILNTPAKVMFSAWVKVNVGKVVIGTHAMVNQGPYSWSTKIGEWEQLRVCTNGSFPPGWFFIYNQAVGGGSFYIDRVEIRAIP